MVNKKFTDLTEKTLPVATDIFAITDDPSGTAVSKKVQFSNAIKAMNIDDALDVTITGNTSGEILKWNGSVWINQTLVEALILGLAGGTMTGDINMGDNDITAIKSAGFNDVLAAGSKTASFDLDFDDSQSVAVTLTANVMTITLQTPLQNDATRSVYITNGGLATITWAAASGSVKFPGGTDPTLTSSGLDIVVFKWDGVSWHGVASLDFS